MLRSEALSNPLKSVASEHILNFSSVALSKINISKHIQKVLWLMNIQTNHTPHTNTRTHTHTHTQIHRSELAKKKRKNTFSDILNYYYWKKLVSSVL